MRHLTYLGFLLSLIEPELSAQPGRIPLGHHVHAEATPQNDEGAVDDSFEVAGVTLHFKKTAAQQRALDQLLAAQGQPRSPQFRRWITPETYAAQFGISEAEFRRVSRWLEAEGFLIGYASRSRTHLVFSGAARQIQRTFQTEIRRYRVNGKLHYANASNPSIPAGFADIVESMEGLDDLIPEPEIRLRPGYTIGNFHYLSPDDLATIYDVMPMLAAGIDGSGQHLAIVGQSAIDPADLQSFRTHFGLPAQNLQMLLVPAQRDPGQNSALGEGDLDLQWSGAIARNATIHYVYAPNAYTALQYVVDQNLAPVVSASYNLSCEARALSVTASYRSVAQQAAAQGITWVNSAGDSGAAGCDANGSTVAQNGAAARFPASIPEVTAVGGTQFDEGSGTFWTATNSSAYGSVLGYIPETVWNESTNVLAGGGGISSVFAKPPWQTGPGVPNDGFRDVPDVALSSASHDGYYTYSGGKAGIYYGTSAAAPVFAAMLTLLNQYLVKTGVQSAPGLGNVNPMLYQLAQSAPSAFHDIGVGNNAVPCSGDSPGCVNGRIGYGAAPGYDLATGLGSVDLFNLAQSWHPQAPSQSLVVISTNNTPVYPSGSNWNYTVTATEEAGIATTITDFLVDGVSQSVGLTASFGKTNLPAFGSVSASLTATGLVVPRNRTFQLKGVDAGGIQWSQTITVPFLALPATPAVTGAGNAASYDTVCAPGMVLAVFGTDLASVTQAAGAVPLLTWMSGFTAYVNGVSAPFYYVSPTQVNVQVPYSTQPGRATLQLQSNNGVVFSNYPLQVTPAAPGIFADTSGFTVPYTSGSRSQTLALYITGEGQVSPALATGSAPAAATPLNQLPKPVLPVSLTIGGKDAPISFVGIPYGLVGVTQINFTVPPDVASGEQPVVVTVGTAASKPARFNVN